MATEQPIHEQFRFCAEAMAGVMLTLAESSTLRSQMKDQRGRLLLWGNDFAVESVDQQLVGLQTVPLKDSVLICLGSMALSLQSCKYT